MFWELIRFHSVCVYNQLITQQDVLYGLRSFLCSPSGRLVHLVQAVQHFSLSLCYFHSYSSFFLFFKAFCVFLILFIDYFIDLAFWLFTIWTFSSLPASVNDKSLNFF